MAFNFKTFWEGIKIFPKTTSTSEDLGDMEVLDSNNKLHFHNGSTNSPVVTESHSATLTNKSIDADNNTITDLEVDNLKAGVLNTDLTAGPATDTQIPSALAVQSYTDATQADVDDLITLTGVPANSTDLGTFSGTIISDGETIKGALQDLEIFAADQAGIVEDLVTLSGVPANSTDLGTFTGTTIPDGSDNKEALQALETALEAHINDVTDAHDASAISFVPTGDITSTEVQSAIVELGTILTTEIDTKITGPASSTDNHLVRFDGTTGKLAQDGSTAVLSDAGALSGLTNLTVDNLNLDGNSITGGTSTVEIGTNVVVTTATEIHNGAVAHIPLVDSTTTGANATINVDTYKNIILTNASLTSIDMLAYGATISGREVTLINRTGNLLTINHNTGAIAAQRIMTPTGAAVSFPNDSSFNFVFDTEDSNWTIAGGTGSGGAQVPDVFVQLTASELITDWATGDNATFLGGGTLAGTFAKETASPLNGTASYKYTQAAGSLNDYLASPVQDVPIRFRGNTATVSFPYLYDGANDDITLVVYDVTNATVLTNSAFNSLDATGSNTSTFVTNVFIPLTCTQIRVGFQTIVLNSGKILQFDDIQVGSDATKYANLIEPRIAVIAAGNAGQAITASVTNIPFIETEDLYGLWNGSQFTAPSDGDYIITGMVAATASVTSWEISVYINGVVSKSISRTESGSPILLSGQVSLTAGQVLSFRSSDNCTLLNTTTTHHLYIEKVPRNTSTNIVTSAETFSTDTAALTYAGSATYTLSTLANAPVGTFITFTYALNTNTRTQTTTAPTQTTSDMNTNGIQIFTRAYNAASTAAQPTAIAIQIGKGMKGVTKDLYKSTSKATGGSLDFSFVSTSTRGIRFKEYEETTGILYLDAGFHEDTSNTSALFRFDDLTTQTNGYVVINASKNPALTGIGAATVAVRATSTSGAAIGTSFAKYTYETEEYDTSNSFASGTFTCPQTGYYNIEAILRSATVTLTTSSAFLISIYKNGAEYARGHSSVGNGVNNAYTSLVSTTTRLNAGDTIEIYALSGVATTSNTTPAVNHLSITKVNVG